jgi:hypothetical protein
VEICDEWRDDFKVFREWALANGYEDGLSIERIDNNGNYEPDNCKWIPHREQIKNTTKTIRIVINGVEGCLKDWATFFGLNPSTVYGRYNRGWRGERLFGPPDKRFGQTRKGGRKVGV